MSENDRMRAAIAQIAEVASTILNNGGEEFKDFAHEEGHESELASQEDTQGCLLKSLPKRLLVKAAQTAMMINPVNAPMVGPLAAVTDGFHVAEPLRLAVVTAKYWGPKPRRFTVSFMESTPADLKARIISHMNAWTKTALFHSSGRTESGTSVSLAGRADITPT